jgi:hypothetical protein
MHPWADEGADDDKTGIVHQAGHMPPPADVLAAVLFAEPQVAVQQVHLLVSHRHCASWPLFSSPGQILQLFYWLYTKILTNLLK